jgi:hypothetical protein
VAPLNDCELVECAPVIVRRIVEVNEVQSYCGGSAILARGFDGHARHHELMKPLVLTYHVLGLGTLNTRER